MGKTKGALSKRDRRVLFFVDRYRLGTSELFSQVFSTGVNPGTNVGRAVRKLVRRGLLRQTEYAPGRSYVVLTRRACRAIGAPDRAPRPLTEQSLPVAMAIALHCVRTGLVRFKDREFRQRYPELWRPGLRSSAYYLVETPEGLKLGMFLVDRGGTARRIKGKIRRLITQRASLPAFVSLIEARRFRVTVLTGSPDQQRNIRRQLGRRWFRGVEVEVALVPELGELLTVQ
jgi:hypothetical protein